MLIPQPLPKESKVAFGAFALYVELGDERSYREVARRLKCSLTNIANFAGKYDWQKRLANLIAEEAERALAAEKKAVEDAAKKREQMKLDHEKRMLEIGENSWARLEQFSKLPVVKSRKVEEIKDDDGRTISQTLIIEPTGINWSSYARAVESFDRIFRLVLGMPTGKHEITGPDGAPLLQASAGPVLNIVVQRDEQSDKVRDLQAQFLREHPEHPQSAAFLREYDAEHDKGNGQQ
jgi:hypothetical protein